MLSSHNFPLPLASQVRKLSPNWIGHFSIAKVVFPIAYQLALPRHIKVHHVFHILFPIVFNLLLLLLSPLIIMKSLKWITFLLSAPSIEDATTTFGTKCFGRVIPFMMLYGNLRLIFKILKMPLQNLNVVHMTRTSSTSERRLCNST